MKTELIKVDNEYRLIESTKHGNSIIGTTDLDYQKAWSDRCQKLSIKNCQAIELGYDLDELISESDTSHLQLYTSDSHELMFGEGFKADFQKALELMENEWDVEIEVEEYEPLYGMGSTPRPKLDADGCLILKRK